MTLENVSLYTVQPSLSKSEALLALEDTEVIPRVRPTTRSGIIFLVITIIIHKYDYYESYTVASVRGSQYLYLDSMHSKPLHKLDEKPMWSSMFIHKYIRIITFTPLDLSQTSSIEPRWSDWFFVLDTPTQTAQREGSQYRQAPLVNGWVWIPHTKDYEAGHYSTGRRNISNPMLVLISSLFSKCRETLVY